MLPGAILLFLTIRISSSEKGRLIREGGGGGEGLNRGFTERHLI